MGGQIFVSYRRSDYRSAAVGIGQYLEREFGNGSIFIDIDLAAGEEFPVVLEQRLSESKVLLALVGPGWDTRNAAGERRLDDPDDWVRREIARALALKITVIPVCVNGAAVPSRAQLPDDIRGMADRQAAFVTDANFRSDMAGLVLTLRKQHFAHRRLSLPRVIVAAVVISVIAVGGTVGLSYWRSLPQSRPPASPAEASLVRMTGSIQFQSDAGDFVGDGRLWNMSDADGRIQARVQGNSVEIFYDGDDNWTLTFAAPEGALLEAGNYKNASRAGLGSPVKPGLEVSGAGRGCNELTGSFQIRRVEYSASGSELQRLLADFEQHCEKKGPALRGSVDLSANAQPLGN